MGDDRPTHAATGRDRAAASVVDGRDHQRDLLCAAGWLCLAHAAEVRSADDDGLWLVPAFSPGSLFATITKCVSSRTLRARVMAVTAAGAPARCLPKFGHSGCRLFNSIPLDHDREDRRAKCPHNLGGV